MLCDILDGSGVFLGGRIEVNIPKAQVDLREVEFISVTPNAGKNPLPGVSELAWQLITEAWTQAK